MLKRQWQWQRRRWWRWQLQYRIPNTFCKFILLCFGGWMFFSSLFSIFQRPENYSCIYELSLPLSLSAGFAFLILIRSLVVYCLALYHSVCISLSLFFISLSSFTLATCVWHVVLDIESNMARVVWMTECQGERGEWVLQEIVFNFLFCAVQFCGRYCVVQTHTLCLCCVAMVAAAVQSTCITMACY